MVMDIATMRSTINEGHSRFVPFEEVFWKFVRTEVGITHIYEEKQSYLKKQVSFQERQQKIEMLLARADFDDDKLNPSDEALAKWSDEALELSQIIKKLGLNKDICSREYLYKFFQTFYGQKNNIQQMDQQLLRFENLTILNLTNNKIKRIENLPISLRELNLTGNLVDEVEPLRQPLESLIHLGVAYNVLKTPALTTITANFPNLFCLDASFNGLCDFRESCTVLETLENIKMLYLMGNPLCLTGNYREILKQRFQGLRILDGTTAFTEAEENAKKKHRKRVQARLAHLGDIPKDAYKIPQADLIPIQDQVVLELEFRLLDQVQGVYINETNCQSMESINLDELATEKKCTAYWVKYRDHHGETVVSDKKFWIENFMIDTEKSTGKTDLSYALRIEEAPTTALRDWLENDVFVELHMSQPKFQFKILEDAQAEPIKDTVLDDEGKPTIETRMLGVMRLDTSKLVRNAELPIVETNYHKHNRFYGSEFLLKPEFMYRDHLITLKDADMELLEGALAEEEAEESKRAALVSQEGVVSQSNMKPGGSKDTKAKDPKAAAKGKVQEVDKNAPKQIEIEYPEAESEPDFILIEKTFNQGKQSQQVAPARRAQTAKSVLSSVVGAAASAAGASAEPFENTESAMAARKIARLQELQQTYHLVRALAFKLAVVLKLNYVPPPPPPREETPMEVPDPKVAAKDAGKKKPAGKK